MADEKEVLLFEVIVNIPQVKDKAEAARAAIARIRAEISATNKELKDKAIEPEAYGKSMQSLKSQLATAENQLKGYTKTLSDNDKAQKSAKGSNDQLKAQLALLTPTYDAMSKKERQATEAGRQLEAQIKSLSDELKTNKSAIGDTRLFVGSYSQAIEQAISGNNTWTGRLKNTASALGEAKDGITTYVQGLKATTEGMGTAQRASLALGLGLKAIGIGLLITAITAVIGFLSKMDAGMDKVEQATAGVSAGIEAFIKVLAPLGELIVDTFTHPIDAIVKFGEALLHPIDSFLKLKQGAEDMANGVASSVGKAASAAVDYTKTMQDLEDRQDSLIGVQAKVNEQVQLALIATKDRSRSEKERIGLLDAAGVAERRLSKEVVAIKKAEYDALKKLQSQKNDLQDSDRKASRQAYAAYVDARAASLQTEQQIQNRRSSLLEQDAADAKQAADKAKQVARDAAQERVYEAEFALLQLKKNGQISLTIEQELLNRRINLLKKQGDLEKVGLSKNAAQRKLIDAKTNHEILEATEAFTTRVAEVSFAIQEGRLSAQLALVQKGSQQELDLQLQALTTRLDREKAAAVDTIKNETQRIAELRRLDAQYNADTESLQSNFEAAQVQRQKERATDRLQTEQDLSLHVLVDARRLAADRIDLEEKTQIALLDIDKKYGRISEEDYLVRLNAIQAKALAARKDLAKTLRDDARKDAKADTDIALANSKVGSKAELNAKIDQLHTERNAELDNANLTEKERLAIIARYARTEKDLRKQYRDDRVEQVKTELLQTTEAYSNFLQAQANVQAKAIDQQETAALNSAGLSADARDKIQAKYDQKRQEAEKKAAEQRRKIAETEAIINTAAAVIKAAPNPFLMALAAVVGLSQLAVIETQQFAEGGEIQLARGGLLDGPSHAQGGIKYNLGNRRIELEGGEGVINKRSMAIPGVREQASRLNQLGGGVAFPGVSIRSSMPVPRSYSPVRMEYGGITGLMANGGIDYDRIRSAMFEANKALPRPVVEVSNIRQKVDRAVQVENRADIKV